MFIIISYLDFNSSIVVIGLKYIIFKIKLEKIFLVIKR